ncbi:bifunctional 2-polyprenyl-6-hydroxyphenol methylase/3-demethylubiquinol 3-O-methyltransferase UbiG [Roseivirga sp. E12]|uniref:class I SAM-dependent methyltransferase n=1 Tax=Roseivirga sp. E12 TaxID=2819237 RepID=UPI001ABCB5C2|nr:class I SAM-dependent methyltransferase [Roseivirga sp. E12]MBO3699504.1 class I SAM-dependent methyltransferase [Roseivirga sp. E12]
MKKIIYKGWYWDAKNKLKRIQPVLTRSGKIVDIGSGYGTVTDLLRRDGYDITPVDVTDHSIREDLKPICYDGTSLPFNENTFDQALLLTVLHHTQNPQAMIAETARVSREVIIIEDVYRNKVQQYLTYFFDSLFNLEFKGHPHTNNTRKGWEAVCKNLGLELKLIRSDRFLLFFRQETYLVIRNSENTKH